MKHLKKLLSIVMGCGLLTSALVAFSSKSKALESKAEAAISTTTFSGASAGDESFGEGLWMFDRPISYIYGGYIAFELENSSANCTLTYRNSLFPNPHELSRVEITVNANPVAMSNNSLRVSSTHGTVQDSYVVESSYSDVVCSLDLAMTTADVSITLENLYSSTNSVVVKQVTFYRPSIMTIAAGGGISSVYISADPEALSGEPSGTDFAPGMVYAFAVLGPNCRHQASWTKVSAGADDVEGAIYQVGSFMNAGLSHDFGIINAIENKQTIEFYDYFGDYIDEHTFTYGDGAYTHDTVYLDDNHTFIGWNSSINVDGFAFGTTITAEEVNSLSLGENGIESLFAVYELSDATLKDFFDRVIALDGSPVELTPEFKAEIDELNAITATLTEADKEIFEVMYACDALVFIWSDYVQLAIDSIGDSSSPSFKENYVRAQAAYEEFPDEYKPYLVDSTALENAHVDYVEALIADIGEVTFPDSREDIEAAREEYEELTPAQQPEVENYDTLCDDEVEFVELEIAAIGEVSLTDECKEKIDSARHDYDALSITQKESVDNYEVLTTAEARYEELKSQPEQEPTPEGEEKKGLPDGAIAGIVIGAIALALSGAYFLLFFLFNKWIIINDKVVRVFRFGKKEEEYRLLTFKFRKQLRTKDLVFDKKKDAEEFLKNSK